MVKAGAGVISYRRRRRVMLVLGRSLVASALILAAGCSGRSGHGLISPSTSAPGAHAASSLPGQVQNANFYFQEDANTARDDLSALGAQQSSLPFDMIDLENDYGSLQLDLISLQTDLSLNNPNDACNVAGQGLTDRSALFGDQTSYGQDVSLATADIGNLQKDSGALEKDFRRLRRLGGESGTAGPAGSRAELRSILAKIGAADGKMNKTINRDNSRVRNWVVRGAGIYRKLRKACNAVR